MTTPQTPARPEQVQVTGTPRVTDRRAGQGNHGQPAVSTTDLSQIALAGTLQVAVPLLVAELNQMSLAARRRRLRLWSEQAGWILGCFGDLLLVRETRRLPAGQHYAKCPYADGRPQRPGDCPCNLRTADVWRWCARAVVALAHHPGGVDFAGVHWEIGARS